MRKYQIWNIAAHSSIVMSSVFIILFIIDRCNPSMDFLGSEQSDYLLLLFCLCSLSNGLISAVKLFGRSETRYEQERKARDEQKTCDIQSQD